VTVSLLSIHAEDEQTLEERNTLLKVRAPSRPCRPSFFGCQWLLLVDGRAGWEMSQALALRTFPPSTLSPICMPSCPHAPMTTHTRALRLLPAGRGGGEGQHPLHGTHGGAGGAVPGEREGCISGACGSGAGAGMQLGAPWVDLGLRHSGKDWGPGWVVTPLVGWVSGWAGGCRLAAGAASIRLCNDAPPELHPGANPCPHTLRQ